jgi:hypothetical protein
MHQSILSEHQYVNPIGLVCQFDFPFKKGCWCFASCGTTPARLRGATAQDGAGARIAGATLERDAGAADRGRGILYAGRSPSGPLGRRFEAPPSLKTGGENISACAAHGVVLRLDRAFLFKARLGNQRTKFPLLG